MMLARQRRRLRASAGSSANGDDLSSRQFRARRSWAAQHSLGLGACPVTIA